MMSAQSLKTIEEHPELWTPLQIVRDYHTYLAVAPFPLSQCLLKECQQKKIFLLLHPFLLQICQEELPHLLLHMLQHLLLRVLRVHHHHHLLLLLRYLFPSLRPQNLTTEVLPPLLLLRPNQSQVFLWNRLQQERLLLHCPLRVLFRLSPHL